MRKRDFIGKRIDVTGIGMLAFASYNEKTFDQPVIEIDLNDFDRGTSTDTAGFIAYSLRIDLTDNRISAIRRIGHLDTDVDQDAGVELSQFPYNSLENQAQDRLRILVTELSPSALD